jgi:hypothetical protein
MILDFTLAHRMAIERVPSRWLGATLELRRAVNRDALVFYAAGMTEEDAVVVGMMELMLAQQAASASERTEGAP